MYLFVLLCILKQNINQVFILGSILGSSYVKSKEVGRKRQTCRAEGVRVWLSSTTLQACDGIHVYNR